MKSMGWEGQVKRNKRWTRLAWPWRRKQEQRKRRAKFVNRGGVYTVGCIPIILGRRNSFLSAYGISCRWSSLLLFGAYSTRSPAERTGSRDQRNCESSNRLPLVRLGKSSLCLPTSWPTDFQFALSTSMEIHLRWKACLPAFSTACRVNPEVAFSVR